MQSALKALKKARKFLQKRNNTSWVILLIGVLIFVFGAVNYYRVRILSFDKVPPQVIQKVKDVDVPVEILIPSIKVDLTVEPGTINNGVWLISNTEATFLDSSAVPGSGGNTVIYGHNLTTIFANLPYLSLGQKIIVKTKSGKLYNYIATQKYFVGPDRVDLVSPSNSDELTVYTCWGLFDSQRAVVVAKPASL